MIFKRRSFLKLLPVLSSLNYASYAAKMTPQAAIAMRFIVASDGHYGQAGTDYLTFHNDMISWVNLEKKNKGLDFLFLNGDLINDDPALYPGLKVVLTDLKVPYFVSRGNHDRVALDVWENIWGYPTNYSYVLADYAFIVGDTSNTTGQYICPDINWFQNEIAKYSDKKGIFVFIHITPSKWTANGIDCASFMALIENTPNVKAIFNGHDHDQDGKKQIGEKPYYFDGHFGGSWGTSYKGYRVVEIYEDNTWQTYQVDPSALPLPVTLLTFDIFQENMVVNLRWSTSIEVNSKSFEVEHSSTGKDWIRIGLMASRGDSTNVEHYSFQDKSPYDGENLYRLKMIDIDGSYSYSRIRSLNINTKSNNFLYPNPVTADEKLSLQTENIDKIRSVKIFSSLGQLVSQCTLGCDIDTRYLTAGVYIVMITYNDETVKSQRLVKR